MANVLLGVTGSVAAILTPELYARLKQAGHRVKVVATAAALYFFDPATLDPSQAGRNPEVVILDEDEWPGRGEDGRYQRGDRVLHIELRRWADALLIAPLDANTLAKLAGGLCDNCLSCVWRAWERGRPVVLAPAMNTLMWEHPQTAPHLRQLAEDAEDCSLPATRDPTEMVRHINERCRVLRVAAPQSKRLACDDVGMGAMASLEEIEEALRSLLSAGQTS
jgi:phosphopantothenoylcysteine decarboxylase